MQAVRRYTFDRSFDPVNPPPEAECGDEDALFEPVEPPEPPPPTFSEEELMEARARGYAEGEEAGRSAAMASAENRACDLLSDVSGQLASLIDAQRRSDAEVQTQAADLSIAVVRRLFPQLSRRHGLEEIEAVVRDCLGGLLSEPKITVRVAPENESVLAPRLAEMAEELGFDGHVVVRPQDGLGATDCRIIWAEGGAERLCDDLWQRIETAVAGLFSDPADAEPATEPQQTDEPAPLADALAGA